MWKLSAEILNWIPVQTSGVVLLAPNFINHLVIWSVSKKSHSRTFAPLTPSVIFIPAKKCMYTTCIRFWPTLFVTFVSIGARKLVRESNKNCLIQDKNDVSSMHNKLRFTSHFWVLGTVKCPHIKRRKRKETGGFFGTKSRVRMVWTIWARSQCVFSWNNHLAFKEKFQTSARTS